MFFKRGAHRIEAAHDLEILAQRRLPGSTVVVRADLVDQRQAGPAGPAQDVHFRFVLAVIGHRAIHHIDDPGALHDGPQQFTLVVVTRVITVLGHESGHCLRPVRGGQAVAL